MAFSSQVTEYTPRIFADSGFAPHDWTASGVEIDRRCRWDPTNPDRHR